ncbi:MAG: DUF1302 family protein [Georgfuchsia sp.]
MKKSSIKKVSFRRAILPASIIAAMAISGSASAFRVDTDNPDLDIRFDNTFRYNAGWRAQDPTSYQQNSVFVGASESQYKSGDMVTNRLDILSEFDFIYKNNSGFRISAASWYDTVYNGHAPQGGPSLGPGVTPGTLFFPGGKWPDETKRYYNGPSGEILDAFVFTRFDFGEVPVDVKLGQHTIYWGETLFSLGDGISAGQSYADIRKAVANPGIEAKEVFKPLNQFSFSAQVTSELNVMGQYFLDWKPDPFPSGGTYFSPVDLLTYNGDIPGSQNLGLPPWSGTIQKPRRKSGDWGIAARWRPEWLDGTAGLYYREYTCKQCDGFILDYSKNQLGFDYDRDLKRTKLTGISLAKQFFGISFGMDLTYRKDAVLQAVAFMPVAVPSGTPGVYTDLGYGALGPNGWAPVGDIYTGTINAIGYDGMRDVFGLPLYDSAVYIVEFDFDGVDKVTKNASTWNSTQNCNAGLVAVGAFAGTHIRANGGCVTGESYGINISIEPKWFQVFPGTDVTLPLFYSVGLKGNSPVAAFGQNEHQGAYSIGVAADVDRMYNFKLSYNGFVYKHVNTGSIMPTFPGGGCPTGGCSGTSNAALGDFSHKATINFTAKATW